MSDCFPFFTSTVQHPVSTMWHLIFPLLFVFSSRRRYFHTACQVNPSRKFVIHNIDVHIYHNCLMSTILLLPLPRPPPWLLSIGLSPLILLQLQSQSHCLFWWHFSQHENTMISLFWYHKFYDVYTYIFFFVKRFDLTCSGGIKRCLNPLYYC